MDINSKIEALRKLMTKENIDAYIIPSSDSHQSEYTGEHFKSRQWISGFTGSAGTVVVTQNKEMLWTDGRYFIQAEKEIVGSEIELFKMGEKNVPSINKYLEQNLKDSQIVGFDGKLFSCNQVETMKKVFKQKNISLNTEHDLIDTIWQDRPELPSGKVFIHDIKYSGVGVSEKLNIIRKSMKEKSADYYLISSLDDIAWLFNIRGNDIEYNPVVISYALIGKEKATLFIENEDISEKIERQKDGKLSKDVKEHLIKNNVQIKKYCDIEKELKTLTNKAKIYLDSSKTSLYSYEGISSEIIKLKGDDIVEQLKAIKNDVEIENFKNCQIRDGVAMVKFLYWLDKNVVKGNVTELSASKKLEEFRSEGENYVSLSFETIAGYKDHGAIVHYSVTEETDYVLNEEGMLLLDSGAQYLDGTTDITRTIVLGEISKEAKRDFTLVLKGHIALSKAKFLYGTTGTQLDVLARIPLWEDGKDFKHGTGHGIGYFLNVHEGPQRISPVYSKTKLEPGMLVTNEPGFYKKDEYGIRTENILLVKKTIETEYGKFLEFETTTYCPIDLKGIDGKLLDEAEKKWINDYHRKVYETLTPLLKYEESEYLKSQTREI